MVELIKKFGAFSIGPIVGAALGIIIVPIITYFISPEEYGRSSMFVLAQGAISMLVYLGMDQAFVREFSLFRNAKDKLMSNAILIPFISVCLLSVVILFNQNAVSVILFDTPNEHTAIISLAVMLPFMVLENFTLLNIRMEEKGVKYSFFTIMLKCLNLIFTLALFLLYEKSFRSVVFAIALSEIANGILLYFVSFRQIKIRIDYVDKELILRMLKFGLPLIPASMLVWALASMDKIMLRALCSYSELGLYSAAFKIVNALGIIQTCFTLFWTPVSYRWYEAGKEKSAFESVSKLVTFVMTVMCMGILLLKNLVAFVLGDAFAEAMYIFPFLLLQPIMYTISESTAMGIGFSRRTSYNILVSGISGGVNIALNYFLIPVLEARGAALATGISYFVFFWARTLISRKLWLKFKVYPYILYSIIIILNCFAHTFVIGNLPYIITIISVIIILVANREGIETIINYAKFDFRKNVDL